MILLMNCNFPFRYKPHVWEFSRLNITHFVMSKRKLNQLCTSGAAAT
jgi:glutamyl/glutaminyl-tRNA synthetase